MTSRKEEIKEEAMFSDKLRKITGMNKKRCTHMANMWNMDIEWRLRTNYLKLNKGFNRNGESFLISKLKKRGHRQVRKIVKGNMSRMYI